MMRVLIKPEERKHGNHAFRWLRKINTNAVIYTHEFILIIKGISSLYDNIAGLQLFYCIGASDSGTTMPYVVARKAYLVIPIGLEKLVAGDLVDLTLKMREPIESLNGLQSMFLLTGEIVTELEAIHVLTGATAFQCSAGGIGGAEGSVWLVFRGTRDQVTKALKLVQSIQGEPPYVE